jgi:hypothetical protein
VSIKVMTAVWEHSSQKEGALLVLLALADCAHDDGTMAFPSVKTLAEKARMSERNARYCLRNLEQSGEIVREGRHRSGTTVYRIVLPSKEGQELPGANFAGGGNLEQQKCRKLPPNRKEPSIPPLTPLTGGVPPNGKTDEKPTRRTKLPADFALDDEMRAFAERRGWEARRQDREFEKFRERHTEKATLSANWRSSWRTWVLNGVGYDERDGRRSSSTRTADGKLRVM